MASDVIFESPKMFGEFDSNGDIFMTGGVMDPKELYLSDLKDNKDSTSSSDSGISNLDDVADYDNVTDLHLDAEFKDLDFSFDFDTVIKEENIFDGVSKLEDFASVLSKGEINEPLIKAENCFNTDNFVLQSGGVIVKSEPLSPSSFSATSSPLAGDTIDNLCVYQEQPISPDFYTVYEDGGLLDSDSPMYSSVIDQNQLSQQQQQQVPIHLPYTTTQLQQQQQQLMHTTVYSPQQHGCIIQPNTATTTQQYSVSATPLSPTSSLGISFPCSPGSEGILSPKSIATVIPAPKFTQQNSSNTNPLVLSPSSSVHHSHSSDPDILSSINPRNIMVLPHQVKQEILSPSSPSSLSSLSPSPSSVSSSSSTFSIIPMGASASTKPSAAINLNAILSTKKKIQPKPGLDNVATPGQWLNSSVMSQVPLTTQPIPVAAGTVVNSTPLITASCPITSLNDSKSMKRAQRIIKNRESASLSRKRKKEYLSSLEERLQQCVDDNKRLQRENSDLKQQLESLLTVNTRLKNPTGLSPAKKICLMCFGLFLVINISGFSLLTSSVTDSNQQTVGLSRHGTGRQLLSVSPSNDGSDDGVSKMSISEQGLRKSKAWLEKTFGSSWSSQDKEMFRQMNWTQAANSMCAMAYINATESIRLAEKLTGWMVQQEEEKRRKKEEKKKTMKDIRSRKKHYPTLHRFNPSAATAMEHQHIPSTVKPKEINSLGVGWGSYSLQIFNGPDQRQQFLNAIPRRNDTFYVLSFSTDYLLVPASAHNKTMRPRMSLLMPVVSPSLNDSMRSGENSVAMMQIDCEILNTNLIHVHRSAFPQEATLNGTTFGRSDSQTGSSRKGENAGNGNKTESDHENYWAKLKGSSK